MAAYKTAWWMIYSHLRADCLYIEISSGTNARNEYGKPLTGPTVAKIIAGLCIHANWYNNVQLYGSLIKNTMNLVSCDKVLASQVTVVVARGYGL